MACTRSRRRRDGGLVQVSLTVSPIIGGDGEPMGVSVIARDITAQVIAQDRLLNNERQMDEAQALAHVGSWEWNLSLERPTWSTEMARLYGFQPEHVPEVSDLVARIHVEDRDRVWRSIRDARTGRSSEEEYRVVGADGEIRHMLGRHRTRTDDQGAVTHIYGAVQDVTEHKRYEADLERLATHDELTGLPNRRTFEERLSMELARARREGGTVSLALIDIDSFKRINDTLGHQVGDMVLGRTGAEFLRQVRSHELIARVGGEEFAWILPGADPIGAHIAVERVRRAMAAMTFEEVGQVTLSAGICTLEPGMDGESLYRYADMALLAAKAGGRNRVLAANGSGEPLSYAAFVTQGEPAAFAGEGEAAA